MLNEAKLHSRVHFEGMDLSIEVPAGGYRRGINKKTKEEWSHKIPASYGYIKGTHSPDGEHLDCYLRKSPKKGAMVYVMHQLTPDGSRFDEDKVMLGYSSKNEAVKAFKDMTFKPGTMFGGCTEFDMEHFQAIAFSSSNSHTMLTRNSTYDEFKRKGLLGRNIKSPLMVARRVCEGLAEGLTDIAETLDKGDLEECLDWSGYHEGSPVESVLTRAYAHYANTSYMHNLGTLSEEEFKTRALNYIMEQDALLTDVEDQLNEEIAEDLGHFGSDDHDDLLDDLHHPVVEQEELEETIVEANNFAVVVHTQIMENIGSAEQPSWATAGTKVQLVQEGFATYGDARSVAAKVACGEIPVEISERAHVLGIDVMPTSEFRQLWEEEEQTEETVEEDMTDDVFFQQQVMEMQAKAGIRGGSVENGGTPTVHETRERLAALTQAFYEGMEEEQLEETATTRLTDGERAHALRVVKETLKKNPHADINKAIRAVCAKLYGDPTLDEEVLNHAEFEYGTLGDFEADARGRKQSPAPAITRTIHIDRR